MVPGRPPEVGSRSAGWLRGCQLDKHLVGMCSDARERLPHTRSAISHQQRKEHNIRRGSFAGLHGYEATARSEMRVVQELLRLHDRRIRQAGGVELRRQLINPMVFEDLAQTLQ